MGEVCCVNVPSTNVCYSPVQTTTMQALYYEHNTEVPLCNLVVEEKE
jgi:hypothetical protein